MTGAIPAARSSIAAALDAACCAALGHSVTIESATAVGGGDIHRSYCATAGGTRLFVKLNELRLADVLAAEADGLLALRASGMRAPEPLAQGTAAGHAYLVLEYLDLRAPGSNLASGYAKLGHMLAAMHRVDEVSESRFGWRRDNYIGTTPQHNDFAEDWSAFWRDHRIGPQLALAERNGHGTELRPDIERLLSRVDVFFGGRRCYASLLHGDLWGGNAGVLGDGSSIVFDPAVYRGDREADIAMTELFGGFPDAFYRAYGEAWPLDPGYSVRRDFYNLYHLLNHLNLFGTAYLGQVRALAHRLIMQLA